VANGAGCLSTTVSCVHVAALVADGFRNLEGRIGLSNSLAILIGENNSGKSNVIDALRLLFHPEAGPTARRWVRPDDFRHDGHGEKVTDTFTLEAELADLGPSDKARMVTCLAPSLGPDAARLRLKATLTTRGQINLEWFGGDSENPDVERWAREAVRWTYLHPLRDAAGDLRPGRGNRLVGLLDVLAPEGHTDRDEIERIAREANAALDGIAAVNRAKSGIRHSLSEMTGGGTFTQKTDLAFADPRFQRITSTLRALAGDVDPLELAENGLGYNNLLYMAVLLAALADSGDALLRLLLVEEPEAHLHPQLQDLLMRYLELQSGERQQVVVTSHSPNLASAARVERCTVLVVRERGSTTSARAPGDFGMPQDDLKHLRRFLDVTKAALLFARGVILVEGVAEQLLIPVLARRLGRPLPRDGVTVVNIGGVAFDPFVGLFAEDRLPYRVAVVSDADPPDSPDPEELEGGAPELSAVAAKLRDRERDALKVCLARKTLEWDLAATSADNWDVLLRGLEAIKPRVAKALRDALGDAGAEQRADRLLEAVRNVKGPFAQQLADLLENGEINFAPPPHLVEAIEWVTRDSHAE
jgi:putative ATP-dependent endonuclease of the OLD family